MSQPPSDEEYSDEDSDSGSVSYDDDDDVQEAPGGRPSLPRQHALKYLQKRDLKRPKRPVTSYNCFIKAHITDGRKGREKAGDMTQRMKTLASQWNSMSDDDKVPYVKAAAKDRRRYAKEKKRYEEDKSHLIKRPRNAYLLFMRVFRELHKDDYRNVKELVREGAKAWNRLSVEKKYPYNQFSIADSHRYALERLHWCNKIHLPRKNDTRSNQDAEGEWDESNDMDTSDDEDDDLKEWLRKQWLRILNPYRKPSPSKRKTPTH